MSVQQQVVYRLTCKLQPDGDCQVYGGARTPKGYGLIRVDREILLAHRVIWNAVKGPIPEGLFVCHHCDNPPCCFVDHLFLGSAADNNADRHAKGRTVVPTNGPDFWRSKTHCPQGHPYSGDNVRYRANGSRRCAECYRQRAAARQAANRDDINRRRREARTTQRSA